MYTNHRKANYIKDAFRGNTLAKAPFFRSEKPVGSSLEDGRAEGMLNKPAFFKPADQTIQRKENPNPLNINSNICARLDQPVANNNTPDNGTVTQTDDNKAQVVPTTQITASNGPNCDPQGVMIDVFLSKSGNTDDSLGITNLNRSDVTTPEVNLVNGVLQSTTAGFQATSLYLLPQTFKDKGSLILQEGGGGEENNFCPKGKYDKYLQITQSGSDKIKEGENEHCSDLTLAYNLSLAKFRDAVNKTAGQKFTSDAQAKTSLQQQTGVHPDKWNDNFWCLASKTLERDKQKWHTPKSVRTRVDKNCQKAITPINAGNFPDVGQHPSTEIIKDCDSKTTDKK